MIVMKTEDFKEKLALVFDDGRGPRKEDVDNELSKPGFGYPDRNSDEDK